MRAAPHALSQRTSTLAASHFSAEFTAAAELADSSADARVRALESENAALRAAQIASDTTATATAAEEAECSVCLSAPRNAIFVPFGHACVCLECGTEIGAQHNAACPVCRIPVTGCMQVFN